MVFQYPTTIVLSPWSCLMVTGGQAHVTSTWASKLTPNTPDPTLLLPSNLASGIMDIDSFPRSETDLAINIRKATSIGRSCFMATESWTGAGLILVRLSRRDRTQTYIFYPTVVRRASLAHGIQANTSEHASSTHGTTSHPSPSGRA